MSEETFKNAFFLPTSVDASKFIFEIHDSKNIAPIINQTTVIFSNERNKKSGSDRVLLPGYGGFFNLSTLCRNLNNRRLPDKKKKSTQLHFEKLRQNCFCCFVLPLFLSFVCSFAFPVYCFKLTSKLLATFKCL